MKQAWTDVGDGFTALGRLIKERYQDAPTDEADQRIGSRSGPP